MSQEQIIIQKVPEVLKLARQKAALGSYPEAIRSYRKALQAISDHIKALNDPFLKQQWKVTDGELRNEVEAIYKLHKSLKALRGESESSKDVVAGKDERALKKANSQANEVPKVPPSVVERFGGQPFSGKHQQEPTYNQPPSNEPKKDPMVWDPPSPKYQQRKPMPRNNLPKWANQPKPNQKPHIKPAVYALSTE
jgi:hypothetical protein